MVEGFITNRDKLQFKEIVLQQVKDILKLSQVEFRGGYNKEIQNSNFSTTEYIPDTRACYINAVVSLSDILLPYFDTTIKLKYKQYIEILDMDNWGVWELIKNNEENQVTGNEQITNTDKKVAVMNYKLDYAKKLFRELNLLLHRIDYLKESIFGEGEENEIVEVDT